MKDEGWDLARVAEDLAAVLSAAEAALCLQVFAAAEGDRDLRLESLRLLQLGLGDVRTAEGQAEVYCGYVANDAGKVDPAVRQSLVDVLAPAFPTPEAEVNRELARLLGMLAAKNARLLTELARQWTDDSTVEDDLHYLIVTSLLEGERDSATTLATARCLLLLHKKLDALEQFTSRNWPQRVGETFGALCERDPALPRAVVDSQDFNHAEHALFITHLPREARGAAIERLWAATVGHGAEPTPDLVRLCSNLPPEVALPRLRAHWEAPDLRDTILPALAARNLGRSLKEMILWAVAIGLFGNLLGFGLTLILNQPPGPVLVITVSLITLMTYFIKRD